MSRRDHLGQEISSGSALAIAGYEQALTLFHGYYGNPLVVIDATLAQEPDFLAGLALRAGLLVTSTEKRAVPELRATVERAERLISRGADNARERAHVAAARAWLDGEFAGATDRYNRLAIEQPRDMLAQQVAHLCNFFFGRANWLRDHVAAALPHHDPKEPSHGYLLGMLAFGLEECGEYARAEQAGRAALAQNARDPWAVHAVAHCFEMQGESKAGVAWMESRRDDWATDNMLAIHNFWHTALFYLSLGERERVLELYDERIRGTNSEVNLDLVDASALLWRLALLGCDVRERFEKLADVWQRVGEEGYYPFNDLHALMAYAGAGRSDDVARTLAGLAEFARDSAADAELARDVGLPAARAFAAYARGDHATVVDTLFGLRPYANRFGGSHAQRDVLELTLLESARRQAPPLAAALQAARHARRQPHTHPPFAPAA